MGERKSSPLDSIQHARFVEPNAPQISNSRCMILQCDFASFVELPDIDSCPCFESCLFFVCHRSSLERLVARPNTNLRFSTNTKQVTHGHCCARRQQTWAE